MYVVASSSVNDMTDSLLNHIRLPILEHDLRCFHCSQHKGYRHDMLLICMLMLLTSSLPLIFQTINTTINKTLVFNLREYSHHGRFQTTREEMCSSTPLEQCFYHTGTINSLKFSENLTVHSLQTALAGSGIVPSMPQLSRTVSCSSAIRVLPRETALKQKMNRPQVS